MSVEQAGYEFVPEKQTLADDSVGFVVDRVAQRVDLKHCVSLLRTGLLDDTGNYESYVDEGFSAEQVVAAEREVYRDLMEDDVHRLVEAGWREWLRDGNLDSEVGSFAVVVETVFDKATRQSELEEAGRYLEEVKQVNL